MKSKKDGIMKYLQKYSYSVRRKRKLIKFREQIQELEKMDKDELDFEYINIKAEFEHERGVFSLFIITVIISVLTNVWKAFFQFIKKVLEYSDTQVDSAVVVQVSFEISAIILIATIFIVLWVLFERTKELKELRRKLMIIEMVRKERL